MMLSDEWRGSGYMYRVIKPKDSLYIFPYNYTYILEKEKGGNIVGDIKGLFTLGEMYYCPDVDYNMKDEFPPHYKLLDSLIIIPKSKNYRYGFDLLDEFADNDWFSEFNMELSFMARFVYNVKRKIKFESEKRLNDSLPYHH